MRPIVVRQARPGTLQVHGTVLTGSQCWSDLTIGPPSQEIQGVWLVSVFWHSIHCRATGQALAVLSCMPVAFLSYSQLRQVLDDLQHTCIVIEGQ
jgi:hypothetical protein